MHKVSLGSHVLTAFLLLLLLPPPLCRWLHAHDGGHVCDAAGADKQPGTAAPHDARHTGGQGAAVGLGFSVCYG